jgi:hypothetical protein
MTSYDHDDDVLTVLRDGATVGTASLTEDDRLVLWRDGVGSVVSAVLSEALSITGEEWAAHPERNGLPCDLRREFDEWFHGR